MRPPIRVLATLHQPVESETPFGGRAVSHEPLGTVWLTPGRPIRRERTEAGMIRPVEGLIVEARADPRLAAGRTLGFGGGDWAIRGVRPQPDSAGRVILDLERVR